MNQQPLPALALQQQRTQIRETRTLARTTVGALACISIISIILIQLALSRQATFEHIVSNSLQERTLTQQLLTGILSLSQSDTSDTRRHLALSYSHWKACHNTFFTDGDGKQENPLAQLQLHNGDTAYIQVSADTSMALTSYQQANLQAVSLQAVPDVQRYYTVIDRVVQMNEDDEEAAGASVQTEAWVCTGLMLLFIVLLWWVLLRPTIARLYTNTTQLEQAETEQTRLLIQYRETLEEVRRTDHGTRAPVRIAGIDLYAVQNGSGGEYYVRLRNGIWTCPCAIYTANHYCQHVKLVQSFIQRSDSHLSLHR